MRNTLIRNGGVVTAEGRRKAGLRISEGAILEIRTGTHVAGR